MEARALAIIETFTIKSDYELPPLKKMLMNGLFALLSEMDIVTDKILLQDPKA
jgi:hypothetical protein